MNYIAWLVLMLSLTGTGPLETQTGLTVKQQLLMRPPYAETRHKVLPALRDPNTTTGYKIYNVKQQ